MILFFVLRLICRLESLRGFWAKGTGFSYSEFVYSSYVIACVLCLMLVLLFLHVLSHTHIRTHTHTQLH